MSDVLELSTDTAAGLPERLANALNALASAVERGYVADHDAASAAVRDLAREHAVALDDHDLARHLQAVVLPVFAGRDWPAAIKGDRQDRTDDPRFPFWVLTAEDETDENRANMEADFFALTFLMPTEAFEDEFLASHGRLSALAAKFVVTYDQAAAQAICLGLIGEGHPEVARRIAAMPASHVEAYRAKLKACRDERLKRLERQAEKNLASADAFTVRAIALTGDPLLETIRRKLRPLHDPVRFRQASPCRTMAVEIRLLETGTAVRLLTDCKSGIFLDVPDENEEGPCTVARETVFDDAQVDEIATAAFMAIARFPDPIITAIKALPRCRPNRYTDALVARAIGWRDPNRKDYNGNRWERSDVKHVELSEDIRDRSTPPRFTTDDAMADGIGISGWSFSVRKTATSEEDDADARYVARGSTASGLTIESATCRSRAAALCHAKMKALARRHGLTT